MAYTDTSTNQVQMRIKAVSPVLTDTLVGEPPTNATPLLPLEPIRASSAAMRALSPTISAIGT